MGSDNLQLACVQSPTSLQIQPLRLFKQVIWGDFLQLPLERNVTDRTGGAEGTEGTDGTDGTHETVGTDKTEGTDGTDRTYKTDI